MPQELRALAGDLSLAVVRMTRHLRGRRTSQVTLTQLSALATLARDGAMTPGTLAARERVQPPSMSEAGRKVVEDEVNAREMWLTEQLRGLDAEQLATMRRAVDIMSAIVNESE